jgi:hypothetical protein
VILERVQLPQVVEEDPPQVLAWRADAVDVDVLPRLPVVRAHSDQVALVADDVDELVLLEEAGERGVRLATLLPRLDRDRDVPVAHEAEAHHDVRDRVAHPVARDQVGGAQVRQIEGRVVPARGEVGLGAVVEVANVVERHALAVDVGPGEAGHLGLPVAVVRGRDAEPPAEDRGEGDEEADERPTAVREHREGEERRRGESDREHVPQPGREQVPVGDRERRPDRHRDDRDLDQQRREGPSDAPHGLAAAPGRQASCVRSSSAASRRRIRRTSSIACGFPCTECDERTTSSDCTPSTWALV